MLKPLHNKILVEPDKEAPTNGILLPDHENIMPDRGKVIAIGSEVTEVKVGDRIIWDRLRVDNIRDRTGLIEKKYLLLPEDLVLAKI